MISVHDVQNYFLSFFTSPLQFKDNCSEGDVKMIADVVKEDMSKDERQDNRRID